MAKTRVAIIGCGTIANAAHAPSYQKNPDVEIAYCVDIIPERAQALKEKFGTENTKAILFPIDGFSDVNAEEVHKAADELIDLLHRYFGDSIEIEVGYVSKEQPRFEFFK